ncbi:MAG: RagB/SusD family nutrient uptake outer membrane protein [Saprospiraceae bacterium]
MKKYFSSYKKLIILTTMLVGIFVTSCNEDLLNPVPPTSLSDINAFDTPERIRQQISGVYDFLKAGNFYGGRFLVYHDIRGDEFLNETTNGVTGFSTWTHTVVSSTNEVFNLWNTAYQTINRANIFIEGVEANKAVLKDDKLAAAYIGEARFVRALSYFSLLSLYARPYADGNGSKLGVPLRLIGQTGPGDNDLARSTVAEVYAQILDDLNFAEQNLPLTYTGSNAAYQNTTRAHRNTAIAFKTRVLLHMGRYADVITEANKIVPASAPFRASSGVAHELQADVTRVFNTPYTTTESIFSMPFTELDLPGTQNGLGSYYNPGPRGIGDYSLNPAAIVGDTINWKPADARRKFIFRNAAGKPWLNKFPAGPQHVDYAPVIRYAEVMLNLAEAIARTSGVDARAIALLNAVRGRSDAATQYTAANFADANALIDAILLERRIELLGEGFRALDRTRLLLPIPGKANVAAVNPSQSEYIWPIPDAELATNKLAVPNP